ncbi:conserved hypothetical protein [Beggiatoa sp. PS]|nr:conserved hypothetical protein [Beggiatoa sp. PS]
MKQFLVQKDLKVDVAYSNPSFEIWYLLHFQYRNTPIDRDKVLEELEHLINYNKSDENIYELFLESQNFAIENAKKLIKQCEQQGENIQQYNPMTTVYKLVELLRSYQENSNDVSNVHRKDK